MAILGKHLEVGEAYGFSDEAGCVQALWSDIDPVIPTKR